MFIDQNLAGFGIRGAMKKALRKVGGPQMRTIRLSSPSVSRRAAAVVSAAVRQAKPAPKVEPPSDRTVRTVPQQIAKQNEVKRASNWGRIFATVHPAQRERVAPPALAPGESTKRSPRGFGWPAWSRGGESLWSSWRKTGWFKRARGLDGGDYEHLGELGIVAPGTIPPPSDVGTKGTLLDSITSAFQTAIPAYAQYRLMKENIGLVKAGKKPLDPAVVAPTVRVQAGVTPQVQNMMRFALIGGGVLLAGALIMGARRK